MLKNLLLPFALLFCLPLLAQQTDLADYKPLASSGTIPPDLLQFYIASNEFDPSRVTGEDGRKFRQQNAEQLARLFASGKVLFNDPLSRYAQKVLDTLLVRDKVLKGKLRVYTLRSAEANAFTSHDGKIFITTGFLANLENEAQLAYVLAHESIHYRNNHVYRDFIQRENAAPGSLAGLRYSREHESEADIEGLRILLSSDYSAENIDWVLDVLFYSYLPVDNVPLERKFFESKSFTIPDSCYLQDTTMQEIGKEDDNYYDAFQTHPSIASRKKEIKAFLEHQKKDTLRRQFLFPEREFYHVRNIARFELSYIYYIDLKLEESIYNSYIMLQDFPGNSYLQKMLAGSLYALCTHKIDSASFSKVHTPHKKLEGYQRQFNYLFEKLSPKQLVMLSHGYAMKAGTDNESMRMITSGLDRMLYSFDPVRVTVEQPPAPVPPLQMVILPDITDNGATSIGQDTLYAVFTQQAKDIGSDYGMKISVLDPFSLLKSDVSAYNDLARINDWVSNRLKDQRQHEFIMTEDIQRMIKKYGHAVSLVSVIINRNPVFKRLFNKKYSIAYLIITFDLHSGRLMHTGSSYTDSKTLFVKKKSLENVLFKK